MSSRPKLSHGGAHQLLGGFGAAHRSDDGGGPAAGGGDGRDGLLGRTSCVNVIDHDGGALAGQLLGVGQAEAASAAGDDCYFSGQ